MLCCATRRRRRRRRFETVAPAAERTYSVAYSALPSPDPAQTWLQYYQTLAVSRSRLTSRTIRARSADRKQTVVSLSVTLPDGTAEGSDHRGAERHERPHGSTRGTTNEVRRSCWSSRSWSLIGAISAAVISTATSGLQERVVLDQARDRQYAADAADRDDSRRGAWPAQRNLSRLARDTVHPQQRQHPCRLQQHSSRSRRSDGIPKLQKNLSFVACARDGFGLWSALHIRHDHHHRPSELPGHRAVGHHLRPSMECERMNTRTRSGQSDPRRRRAGGLHALGDGDLDCAADD